MAASMEEAQALLKRKNVYVVHFLFVAPDGSLRTKSVLAREILRTIHVSLRDGVSVNGSLLPGYRDREKWFRVVPELETLTLLPVFSPGQCQEAACFCHISNTTLDSRAILARVQQSAAGMGLFPMGGMALAYALRGIPEAEGNGYYQMCYSSPLSRFSLRLMDNLMAAGVDVESYMPYGAAHNGVEFVPQGILKSADQVMLSRWIAAAQAMDAGYAADFTYPFEAACPLHISVWKDTHDANLFFDPEGPLEFSGLARSFMAGILKHYDALFAVLIGTGRRMPKREYRRAMSSEDADTVLGIPEFFVEKEKRSRVGWSKRCIFRGIQPDANLYLAMAALYAAGLDGVRNSLVPEDYCDQGYTVRSTGLGEKAEALARADCLTSALGGSAVDYVQEALAEMREGG